MTITNTLYLLPSQNVFKQLTEKLLPLAEEFANVKLEYTSKYGVR